MKALSHSIDAHTTADLMSRHMQRILTSRTNPFQNLLMTSSTLKTGIDFYSSILHPPFNSEHIVLDRQNLPPPLTQRKNKNHWTNSLKNTFELDAFVNPFPR